MKNRIRGKNEIVLVCVLKDARDLRILLAEKWYRMPHAHRPVRPFSYFAFYQPVQFGPRGKRIQYYARVLNSQIVKRTSLLKDEPGHPRAGDYYLRFRIGKIKELPRPIRNVVPRRISFGYTTLGRLLTSKNILQLYSVVPTEQIVEGGLRQAGMKAVAQYHVSADGRRYCLDFAIFCNRGSIAIECDNKKAHSGSRQRAKDKIKNAFLRRHGWTVIRLRERDIISDLGSCMRSIQRAMRKLGGL